MFKINKKIYALFFLGWKFILLDDKDTCSIVKEDEVVDVVDEVIDVIVVKGS